MIKAPTCPYCGESAILLPRGEVDADNPRGKVWACLPCDAWVPTHYNSLENKPMGRLANAELRETKREALEAFTSLWRAWEIDRRTAYAWLAHHMGLSMSECDFGKFDMKQSLQAYEIANDFIPDFYLENV